MAKLHLFMTFFVLLVVLAHFDNPMDDVGAPLMNSGGVTMAVEGSKDSSPIASVNKGKSRQSRPFNKLITRNMEDYVPLCHDDQLCGYISEVLPKLTCDDECNCDHARGICYAPRCHFNAVCAGDILTCDPECECNKQKGFCATIPDPE